MKWEDCNFLEVSDYQRALFSKEYIHLTLCRLKDHYELGGGECAKQNCIFMKIANKLGV